jgi:predicted alpha/beta hydrolase family esterase
MSAKRAVILHGTSSTPASNWFPWLEAELEKRGYDVWVPQLPDADEPNARKYTDFLLAADWDFQDNLLIGHSSGAVEILHLLQRLPDNISVKTAVLAAVFSKELADEPEWKQLKGLFEEPFDFAKIKTKAQKFLFVHGADDPWCDPKQAQDLAQNLDSEYITIERGQHFSTALDPSFTEFPQLISLLDERKLL